MQKNILVVDDESLLVEMVSRCLTANDYTVTTANSGEDAFSFLNMRRFDLILCDIHMDNMDGFAILAVCKALHPQTKVILCSGDIVYETVSRAFACGADGFLAKPFLLSELLHQTNKCLPLQQPKNLEAFMAAAAPHDTAHWPEKLCGA
ncbi:MAG: response regulator [Proteobacteria bacterium]|nr:response regulator [Pseudomonadota bacterium]